MSKISKKFKKIKNTNKKNPKELKIQTKKKSKKVKNCQNITFLFQKSEIFKEFFFSANKKYFFFLNIRNMRFDQRSPVQPNPEKYLEKFNFFCLLIKHLKIVRKKFRKENAILLVLPIEEISLRPELSSPANFRIQGGPLSVTCIGAAAAGAVAGRYFSFLI